MTDSITDDIRAPLDLVLHTPVKGWLQITAACNMRCKQCYGDCGTEPPTDELQTDEFIRVLEDMADTGVIELLMEGGEPLVRPDLFEILGSCTDRILIRLRTNATLLDAPMATKLKEVGVGSVVVDFMGASAETHDWHYETSGAFEKTKQGFEIAVEHGLDPAALMIMTRRNVAELQDFVDMAVALGAKRVGILRLYPLGRARDSWQDMALTLPEQMQALAQVEVPDGIHLMRSWHPRDANCCWQSTGVTSSGRSVGCSYLREFVNFGDLRTQDFLSTWHHPHAEHLRKRQVHPHCPDCAETQGSAGGCRSTAFAFTGDWNAPDPFCTTTNGGIDVSVLPPRRDPQT